MSLLLLFSGAAPAASTDPGGGGFGAVMSREFLERYQPSYQAKPFESRYKPTIRKQKP
jgi:hypothetical protein